MTLSAYAVKLDNSKIAAKEIAAPWGGHGLENAPPVGKHRGAKDIFLLIGQSNMAGRGELGTRISTERVEKLDKRDQWVEAVEPLHFDKPSAGGGLGASFARIVADHNPSKTVGLVPCAVGGSALNEWMPGAKLYVEAVRRAKIAQKDGTIRGILWHQGESDADQGKLQNTYNARLAKMVAALRSELGLSAAEVPFIYGAIGEFKHAVYCEGNRALNAVMRNAVKDIPNSHWVEAADLRCNSDMIHFDLASVRLLGERYATAYLLATKKNPVCLANVYSDHMIFQRDQPMVLVGGGMAGTTVTANDGATAVKAMVGKDGCWKATLPARKVGDPFVITVKTSDDQVQLRDVLVGELWLCGGREKPIGEKFPVMKKDGELRFFSVPKGLDPDKAAMDAFGVAGWKRYDMPDAATGFSAANVQFAIELRKKLGVPVGLVEASWNGTGLAPWISESALKRTKLAKALDELEYARTYQPIENGRHVVPRSLTKMSDELQRWEQKVFETNEKCRSKDAYEAFWRDLHSPNGASTGWDDKFGLRIPEPAFVWYKWTITTDAAELTFEADTASDTDVVWFDGKKIGETGVATPYYWGRRRRYAIPALKPGRHVLVIRVNNHFGDGGIFNPRLVGKQGVIDLAREKFRSICWAKPNLETGFRPPSPWGSNWEQIDPHGLKTVPTTLYNRMIAPLAPFRFAGVRWTPDAENAVNGKEREALAAALRETFGRPDMAFVCESSK